MARPLDQREVVPLEKTIRMEMIISQGLINVLVRNRIDSGNEDMNEVTKLKVSLPEGR
jgi:hypothetical protein